MVVRWKIRHIDWWVLVPYGLLCIFSIMMVFSASYSWVTEQYLIPGNSYMIRQAVFVVLGFVFMGVTFFSNRHLWRKHWFLHSILFITAALLILVLIMGKIDPKYSANGASAWIPVGPLHLQPAEFAKLSVILYLADIMAMRQRYISKGHYFWETMRHTIGPLVIIAALIFLVLLEPDTGGTAILLAICFIMTLASGFPWQRSLAMLLGAVAALGAGFFIFVKTLAPHMSQYYQVQRLLAVVHPFELVKTSGKQLVNSMYAINHGGLFGVGMGNGVMKTGYLPEPYTDFILSTITEELGIVGATLVVGAIVFLVIRIVYIGNKAKNPYNSLLMYGIATLIMIQMMFNVGAVVGLLPITGVTLPFISYGGSSMLVLSIAIGMVLNVSARESYRRELERDGKVNA